MTIHSLAGMAPTEFPDLLFLLPIRPFQPQRPLSPSRDTQTETIVWKSDAESAASLGFQRLENSADQSPSLEWDRSCSSGNLTRAAAQLHWECLLQHARASMFEEQVSDAVQWVQRAHTWKNQWEKSAAKSLVLKPNHWVILSACSTAAGDDDTAAAFAVQAWHAAGHIWTDDFEHDFRNSRADAATLLALSRMRQCLPDRAVELLEYGINGHRVVGDLEQLAADFLLLSLCFEARADTSRAVVACRSAALILRESLDPTRHHRGPHLVAWLQRNGHPRSLLIRNSRPD